MADLQTGYQHTTIMTCCLHIFQAPYPANPDYDVMAYDIISPGKGANLPFPFLPQRVHIYQIRQDYLWEGVCRDRIGSHTVGGWVVLGRRVCKTSLIIVFPSRLNIPIIKLPRRLLEKKSMRVCYETIVSLTGRGFLGFVIQSKHVTWVFVLVVLWYGYGGQMGERSPSSVDPPDASRA